MADEREKPLEVLEEAVRQYVNAREEEAVLLVDAVLSYQTVRYNDEGVATYQIFYAVITPNSSPAASVGVMDLARDKIAMPMVMPVDDEEDE